MPEQLTRSDYEYILSALKYARYAHEETHYASEALKHLQLSHLDHMEEKLRALRDAMEQPEPPTRSTEFF